MAADPLSAKDLPEDLQHGSIALPEKPTALIEYSFYAGGANCSPKNLLIVFLNGLIVPQLAWYPVIATLLHNDSAASLPSLMTYDRYGQGRTTARDPLEIGREIGHGHNLQDAAHDLHSLVATVLRAHGSGATRLFLVANSIGCPLARLYAQAYPGAVAAMLFLDSNITNTDFVSLWPDPDSPDFDAAAALPEGVTVEQLRQARQSYADRFHPSLSNPEGLSRRDLALILPRADTPRLQGPGLVKSPLLTVVGHDPVQFAKESESQLGTPPALTDRYANRAWHSYNESLLKIADPGRSKGPVIATGCGHFIQRDDPTFVAKLIVEMLEDLRKES